MGITRTRVFVTIASAAALLAMVVQPQTAGAGPKPNSVHTGRQPYTVPVKPSHLRHHPSRYVIRSLKPAHRAVTRRNFLHPKRGRVHFAHKLYGRPGHLATRRPGSMRATSRPVRPVRRSRFVPSDNRKVKAPPNLGHIRRANVGCPTGWTCTDIGSDNPAGSSVTYTGTGGSLSALSFSAGGPGVNDSLTSRSTQGFYYAYQAETATSVSLSAQVTGQTQNGSVYDTSGVMIRSGTGATNAYFAAYAVPNSASTQGGVYVDYQASNGGSPVNLAYIPETTDTFPGNTYDADTCITGATASCYLAIERINLPWRAQGLAAYWSSDGTHWQFIAGSQVNLGGTTLTGTIDIGAYATSDSSGNASTADFASVSLQTADLFDEDPTSCPPTYQCSSVGSSVTGGQWSVPSNTWQASDPWTVAGSGTGLADSATSDNRASGCTSH